MPTAATVTYGTDLQMEIYLTGVNSVGKPHFGSQFREFKSLRPAKIYFLQPRVNNFRKKELQLLQRKAVQLFGHF